MITRGIDQTEAWEKAHAYGAEVLQSLSFLLETIMLLVMNMITMKMKMKIVLILILLKQGLN